MEAGSGDVVFAPLYQALRARGVRFAFLHRVDQLHVSDDGGSIEAVSVARQAQLADGRAEYDPLVRIKGLPCFPSRPLDEQLVAPATLDLESAWSDRSSEETMVLRAGEDFDDARARDVARHRPSCLRRADRALASLARDGRPRGDGAHPVAADLAAPAARPSWAGTIRARPSAVIWRPSTPTPL